jgi:D-inositol-3-phosphate glycosyltransferase
VLDRLASLPAEAVVLLHGFRVPFHTEILRRIAGAHPAILMTHGMSTAPVTEMKGLHRPATYLRLLAEQRALSAALTQVEMITAPSQYAAAEIRKLYGGRIEPLTMGCDFAFWHPIPASASKAALRARLGLPSDAVILLSAGNFVPLKRFEALIATVESLEAARPCFLIIAGHGSPERTGALQRTMEPLARRGRGLLHPYVTGEALRDLYWASDLYVTRSVSEGSSVSVMKAMACGLPVVSTPVGETAERMAREGAGLLIPDDDRAWRAALQSALDARLPEALDRELARGVYDWRPIATRCVQLIQAAARRTAPDSAALASC